MNTPLPASPFSGANPSGIISPGEYDQYAASWLLAAGDPAGTVLAQSFVWNKVVLPSLTFTALQIARLVSTVGAASIKARFLIMHDTKAQPHFTIALFVTDALDKRISSYYLADTYWLPKQPQVPAASGDRPVPEAVTMRKGGAHALTDYYMPAVLTDRWLAAWGKITRVTPDLFATSYGPLRGYSYGVKEFVSLLRDIDSLTGKNVLLEFDLHDYYHTAPQDDVLMHTFGLLLWTETGKMLGGAEGVNMGTPCPPAC